MGSYSGSASTAEDVLGKEEKRIMVRTRSTMAEDGVPV